MAKSKKAKKKKDLDFQKVKLKVGRRLKRDDNETKAEFASRKIVLKEVKSYSNDPISALARHSDHISFHGKLTLLNHFNSALAPEMVGSLNKPILDSLSKFLIDQSDQVRGASIKCLKTCYNHIKNQHMSTTDFLYSLKPYLDCAYTHVARDIQSDCQKFIEYFVNINDPHIFEPLMAIILRRHEVGTLTVEQTNLAVKLKRYFIRYRQKQAIESQLNSDQMEPLVWTERNFFIDLDSTFHTSAATATSSNDIERREVFLVSREKKENIIERYLRLVKDEENDAQTNPRQQQQSSNETQPAAKRTGGLGSKRKRVT